MNDRLLSTAGRRCVALALLTLTSCAARREAAALAPEAAARWDAFIERVITAHFNARPQAGVNAGRHEYDGKLPDFSREGLAAELRRLHALQDEIRAFSTEGLDERRRFEHQYVRSLSDTLLFEIEGLRQPFRNPGWYRGALDPNVYLTREYAPLAQRLQAYVTWAKAVPAAAAQVRANLEVPMPRTFVNIGRLSFGGLAKFCENDVPRVFQPVADERLQAELKAANAQAVKAFRDLDAYFASLEATANDAFALGPERFQQMLRAAEGVDIPLERLREIGEQDMERNLAALKEACAKLVPGQPIPACIERVNATKPKDGAVQAARRQLGGLKQFLVAQDLISIPSQEEAGVDESPPHMRWNSAYIEIPGPYEHGLPSIYYISPPDPSWTPEEREAYVPAEADLLFTSVHEVWPGHFLQSLHAHKAESRFGQIFRSYAFTEGWAHYAEEMMWQAGLGNGSPEVHVGQLLNALLRNARYLSAIGLHTRGMTVAESERLFREKAFQDPGNARQQAARGTFDPGYLNYTLGKLMILKLRDDWSASRGGRKAWKAFHDQFLSYGSPPVPMVRAAMLGPDAGPPI